MRGHFFFKSWLNDDTFQHERHIITEIEGVERNGLLMLGAGWSRQVVIGVRIGDGSPGEHRIICPKANVFAVSDQYH